MNSEQIFYEFSKNESADYYAQLAKEEVLLIPILIQTIIDNENGNCMWAGNMLEKISSRVPLLVYAYFDYIVRVFDKSTGLFSWKMWKVISSLLPYDSQNKWDLVKQKYFESLNSPLITEFSSACESVPFIVRAKPKDKEKIVCILKQVNTKDFLLDGQISKSCSLVAKQIALNTLNKIEQIT